MPTVIPTPDLDLVAVLPEIILAAVALIMLVTEAFLKRSDPRVSTAVALAAFAGALFAAWTLWDRSGDSTVLGGMISTDRFAVFFRFLLIAGAAVAVWLANLYFAQNPEDYRAEFAPLLMLSVTGMTLLAASANLLMVFLALEVLSLALYILTGFSRSRVASQEGSVKYFLLGAFSSAFLLYGIAMTYGATGTIQVSEIARKLAGTTETSALALLATGLLTVALGFKVAAVPFHMWTPDVYQGAPTPVTAFMSAGTKVAAFAALLRLFMVALFPLQWEWAPFMWVLAAVTMVVGSVLAIAQSDLKRMLAYSSVAHAGFILVGVAAANQTGVTGAMFYLVAYSAMILGAFGVVMLIAGRGDERTSLSAFAGLAQRSPGLAALMTLFLLSLAGIPGTAGFIAKVSVFNAAIQAGSWPLALVATLASVIAAFFYIRVIVQMYMEEPEDSSPIPLTAGGAAALAPVALVTLGLGVFPSFLFSVLETASILRL
jgi:NADH-quinone oxidoreductase subunit N